MVYEWFVGDEAQAVGAGPSAGIQRPERARCGAWGCGFPSNWS